MQAPRTFQFAKPSVIPGFGLTLGYSVTYLTLIVLIPLAGLVIKLGVAAARPSSGSSRRDERTVDALW